MREAFLTDAALGFNGEFCFVADILRQRSQVRILSGAHDVCRGCGEPKIDLLKK
jgi:hypothetical protein